MVWNTKVSTLFYVNVQYSVPYSMVWNWCFLALMFPMVIHFKGPGVMIVLNQFYCISLFPLTKAITGETKLIVPYYFKMMLIYGILLLIKGATVIKANVVLSTGGVHEKISAIPVL